ncbi:MAG: polysaccharide deacetylase family protein [Acidobacteriota bacterium]|nr:polysaccharide deacetylase family protein [Acidobacteriota bacterium]
MPVFSMICLLISPLLQAGEIALSFDDAPMGQGPYLTGPQRTETLIRKLEELDIPQVVFFCTTRGMDKNEGDRRLAAYAEAGHLLANHTHTHPRIAVVGADAFSADIRKAHERLKDLPGFVPWFRYPLLNQGRTEAEQAAIQASLDDMGYRRGYVTVDNYDWALNMHVQRARRDGKTVDMEGLKRVYVETMWACIVFYDQMARETLGRSPRHVLLLHENDLAALFIDALVNHIRAEGWKIISPTLAYRDELARIKPKKLCHQGRVVCLAQEARSVKLLKHVSEDTEYLGKLLLDRGVIR